MDYTHSNARTVNSRNIGGQGEQIALSILQRKGFEIMATNWRNGKQGEIDIVAFHPEQRLLNFVEVKARRNAKFGEPIEAVTPRKQAQLLTLSEAFLAAHPELSTYDVRFDVIGIYFPGQGKPADIIHLENAIEL